MTFTNDPPVVASVELIPDSDEKADLDSPSGSGGKLVIGQAPNITITETSVVADAAERLALDVQEGDVAIQTNVSSSFIFTGGDNIAPNWQVLDFDAVGAIAGEDINPSGIAGSNIGTAGQGQVLTSDGIGGLFFSTPEEGSQVVRNGSTIEYVALNIANLPTQPTNGSVALVTLTNEYVQFTPVGPDPFNIESAKFDFAVNSTDGFPYGMAFNSDGSKFYEADIVSEKIYQFTLATPFDLSTRTLDLSINSFAGSRPEAITWNNDGLTFYQFGSNPDNVYQATLTSAFDLSTATLDFTFDNDGLGTSGIVWNNDGTSFYESSPNDDTIIQYDVSNPFDLSTATFDNSIASQGSNIQGIAWNNDGTKFYEIDNQSGANSKIYASSLSAPFDLSSATLETSISSFSESPRELTWNDDGSILYESNSDQTSQILQLNLESGGWEAI